MCTCSNLVKTTAITQSGTKLNLTIPARALYNGEKLCVCLAQSVNTTQIDSMVLVVGNTSYPIITDRGNNLYSDQKYAGTCKTVSTPRTVLCVRFASDTKAFVYAGKNPICPTHFSFPVIGGSSVQGQSAENEATSTAKTKPAKE